MALSSQALTTLENARIYLDLYTLNEQDVFETLTADTAGTTYSFVHSDIAPYTVSIITEYSGTASDTIETSAYTIDYSAGTITFSAARTGTITCGGYSYFTWTTDYDRKIERHINAVSAAVIKYCGRNLIAETYTEWHTGLNQQKLLLNNYPINYITSVSIQSAAQTAGTDYLTSNSTFLQRGILFNENGWDSNYTLYGYVGEPWGATPEIEVVYSAGYTLSTDSTRNLPEDIEYAVLGMVADRYTREIEGTTGLKKLVEGKLTYEWFDSALEPYTSVLNPYRSVVV